MLQCFNFKEFTTIKKILIKNIFKEFIFSSNWKDQGKGNKKASLRMDILRNNEIMYTINFDKIAEHYYSQVSFEIPKNIVNCILPNDIILIKALAGNGGGHYIFLDNNYIKVDELKEEITFLKKELFINKNIIDITGDEYIFDCDDFPMNDRISISNDIVVDSDKKKVSIILPTLNRYDGFKNTISNLINQTYKDIEIIIIDDGSELSILKLKESYVNELNDKRITFLKNKQNMNIPYSINKGYEHSKGDYITWVSDDNIYYNNFIELLVSNCKYFSYSEFDMKNEINKTIRTIKKKYDGLKDLINNFKGLGSFMFSRNLIDKINFYDNNLFKIEDYEYLLRIFTNIDVTEINYVQVPLMQYILNNDCLSVKDSNNDAKIVHKNINFIYDNIHKNLFKKVLICFSNTGLEQVLNRITILNDNEYIKILVNNENIVKFEAEYNLLILDNKYINIIFNNFQNIIIYYNDISLQNIKNYNHIKIFDLTYDPRTKSDDWKFNLEKCVNESDYVMYSHPEFVNYLNEIDNTKTYYDSISKIEIYSEVKLKAMIACKKLDLSLNEEDGNLKEIINVLLENKIYKKKFLVENNFNFIIKELDKYFLKNDSYSNYSEIYNPINVTYINNIPKILFTYWDMSNLTFMHFLTLYTLKKHHPDYEVILYYPKRRFTEKTWTTFENKNNIDSKCYKKYLMLLDIRIIEIDFDNDLPDIPFYLSEVIKSDFFRLLICKEVGGIWFDMDTFWINSIQNIFDNNINNTNKDYYTDLKMLNKFYNNETIYLEDLSYKSKEAYKYSYFVMCSQKQDNENLNNSHYCQYILLHNKNSKLIKLLYDNCLYHLKCDMYESIGTPMFSKILSKFMLNDTSYNYNKNILNINIFAPYKWYQMDNLFEKNVEKNLNNSSCLHWFNGSPITKKFIQKFCHYNIDSMDNCSFKNIYNNYLTNDDKLFLKNMDSSINDKKISIVMSYYNRKLQLIKTLESIIKSDYINKEIIIVDDNSREDQRVESFICQYKKYLDIKVITIKGDEKTWMNPCIPYNIGIKASCGDIVVIQNPEVMHIGDCLTFITNNLQKKDWLSFNCYGSPNFDFNEKITKMADVDIFNVVKNMVLREGGNSVARDDVGGWLNHYNFHFVGYHYLAAIHKTDLNEYMDGGFNEKFKNGTGCDDDEFIKRLIFKKFSFKISEFKSDKPFCLHLYHEKPSSVKNFNNFLLNKKIFDDCCKNMNFEPENDIKKAPVKETPLGNICLV